jgi:hypothetical protein
VIVKNIGGAQYFQEIKRIVGDTIIGASNIVASEADGGKRGRCVPPYATAEYGTVVMYTAGEVGGLEEHASSWEFNNVDIALMRMKEMNRTDLVILAKNSLGGFPRTPMLTI